MRPIIREKFSDAKELAEFYAISVKTARNNMSEMRRSIRFGDPEFFRLSGRVWLPAFDNFLKMKGEK